MCFVGKCLPMTREEKGYDSLHLYVQAFQQITVVSNPLHQTQYVQLYLQVIQ